MLYLVRRCRFSDLNLRPSSRQTRKSGVIERRIGTAGSFGATSVVSPPVEMPESARCTLWISAGKSAAVTELLPTYAETISAVISMTSDFSSILGFHRKRAVEGAKLIHNISSALLIASLWQAQGWKQSLFQRNSPK